MKNLFKYTELISGSGSCTKDITEYDINGLNVDHVKLMLDRNSYTEYCMRCHLNGEKEFSYNEYQITLMDSLYIANFS